MGFFQCSHDTRVVSVPESLSSAVTFLLPLTYNSFLILRLNNTFELRSIRQSAVILQGQIPMQFVPCSMIQPISRCSEPIIFLKDCGGNICRLNTRDGRTQIRQKVHPEQLGDALEQKKANIQYKVLDEQAQFLLGWTVQVDSLNMNMFAYHWDKKQYSNLQSFTKSFYNFRILTMQDHAHFEDPFVIFSTGVGAPNINAAELQLSRTLDATSKQPEIRLNVVSMKNKKSANPIFPFGGVYLPPYIYVMFNSPWIAHGILQYNFEQNTYNDVELVIPKFHLHQSSSKSRGLLRKFLGILDGVLVFSYKINAKDSKYVLGVATKQLSNLEKVDSFRIGVTNSKQPRIQNGEVKDFYDIRSSLDGCSFHQYKFECEGLTKKCREEKEQIETSLRIQTTFRISKNYNYFRLGEEMGLSLNIINAMIDLL